MFAFEHATTGKRRTAQTRSPTTEEPIHPGGIARGSAIRAAYLPCLVDDRTPAARRRGRSPHRSRRRRRSGNRRGRLRDTLPPGRSGRLQKLYVALPIESSARHVSTADLTILHPAHVRQPCPTAQQSGDLYFDVAPFTPADGGTTSMTSIRRFVSRFSAVSFGTAGRSPPWPTVVMRLPSMPLDIR